MPSCYTLLQFVPVVVFANFYPEKVRLSEDRWHIVDLSNAVQTEKTESLPAPIPEGPTFPDLGEAEELPAKKVPD